MEDSITLVFEGDNFVAVEDAAPVNTTEVAQEEQKPDKPSDLQVSTGVVLVAGVIALAAAGFLHANRQ